MSTIAASSFLEAITDSELTEFKAAMDTSVGAIVKMGARKGYLFSGRDLRQAIARLMDELTSPGMLNDAELETTVGGLTPASSNNLKQVAIAIHNHARNGGSATPFWITSG